MPFNGSGVFSRLYDWTDDRDAAIPIDATKSDAEIDGIAAAINDIVNGTQPLTGAIKGPNGTASAPSHSFTADPDTGMYRSAANNLSFATGGVEAVTIGTSQVFNFTKTPEVAGSDVLVALTYDPTSIAGDAFNMSNMVEDATAKVMTDGERTKIGHLSVTQTVDLDQMETDIGLKLTISNNLSDLANASTARTNLGVAIGSDVQAFSSALDGTTASFTTALETKLNDIETDADVTDETNVTASLDGASLTNLGLGAATDDVVLIQDVSHSKKLKTVTAQSIADLASGGGSVDWTDSWVTAQSTNSANIPGDDTIPQITEGTELTSISGVVVGADEKVEIQFGGYIVPSSNVVYCSAMFRDDSNDALLVIGGRYAYLREQHDTFFDEPAAGTYTYSMRIGANSGNTYINGLSTRYFGGAMRTGMRLRVVPK